MYAHAHVESCACAVRTCHHHLPNGPGNRHARARRMRAAPLPVLGPRALVVKQEGALALDSCRHCCCHRRQERLVGSAHLHLAAGQGGGWRSLPDLLHQRVEPKQVWWGSKRQQLFSPSRCQMNVLSAHQPCLTPWGAPAVANVQCQRLPLSRRWCVAGRSQGRRAAATRTRMSVAWSILKAMN
jgi:hypothetical protein